MEPSSTSTYYDVLNSFKAGRLSPQEVQERLADLVLLYDFVSSLTRLSNEVEVAEHLLLSAMGLAGTRGGAFLKSSEDRFDLLCARGPGSKSACRTFKAGDTSLTQEYYAAGSGDGFISEVSQNLSAELLIRVGDEQSVAGLLALGKRSGGKDYTPHQVQMLVSFARMAANALRNAGSHAALEELSRQLSLKVYQLNSLFELSKDFFTVWDSEAIFRIMGSSLIGQMLVSRCIVVSGNESEPPMLRFVRGVKLNEHQIEVLQELELSRLFVADEPLNVSEIYDEAARKVLETARIQSVFPVTGNDQIRGFVALGQKSNRKSFTSEDQEFIGTLGNLALVADANVRMQKDVLEKQRIEKELALARDIQLSLLPKSLPDIEGYELASFFQPYFHVGGDYYDFMEFSPGQTGIAIGDVSGKSTPAALIMANLQASLRTIASLRITSPSDTLERINILLTDRQSSKYVTFFYGVLDGATHTVRYTNAGHCYPVVIHPGKESEYLQLGGMVMGFFKENKYQEGVCELEPGAIMALYTDGLSELLDPDELEEFGPERFADVIEKNRHKNVLEIRDAVLQALNAHCGGELKQGDDLTFILLKRLENG